MMPGQEVVSHSWHNIRMLWGERAGVGASWQQRLGAVPEPPAIAGDIPASCRGTGEKWLCMRTPSSSNHSSFVVFCYHFPSDPTNLGGSPTLKPHLRLIATMGKGAESLLGYPLLSIASKILFHLFFF